MPSVRGAVVLQAAVFVAGVVLPSVLIGSLGASHVPFQPPVVQATGPSTTGPWQVIHVVADGCACSNRVRAYLQRRRPLEGVRERMVTIESASRLRLAGLDVEVTAAPVLIVLAPDGRVRYTGGYSRRRDAQDGFHDQEIIAALAQGRAVAPLPVYGCATSHQLRARQDPFGLKALFGSE